MVLGGGGVDKLSPRLLIPKQSLGTRKRVPDSRSFSLRRPARRLCRGKISKE